MKGAITIAVVALAVFMVLILLERVIVSWSARRWVAKTLRNLREGKLTHPRFQVSVCYDADGFWIEDDKVEKATPPLAWAQIIKAVAFKRDLWATDRVCVLLSTSEGIEIEVHEEMNGWLDFVTAMPRYLPGCLSRDAWLWDITVPAFAPNMTELFVRRAAQRNSGEET